MQARINTIYRRMLGVPQGTNTAALYNEMGLNNQLFRAQVQVVTLKFRNHNLNIPDNILVKQLYMALRSDTVGNNSRILNGVRSYMDPLADSVDCRSSPKMMCDVKKDAHELLWSLQRKYFETAKVDSPSESVRAPSVWSSTDRTAPYLLRKAFPSLSLTEGRRLKAKLRLGSQDLRCHVNNDGRVTKSEWCRCCSLPQAVRETVYDSIGDCTAYDEARKECFSFIGSKVPSFGALSKNKKVDFLLSDDNPDSVTVDASIYRFLYALFLQRAKLVEPSGAGKGSSVS
jgi:hypothetical protein